MLNLGNLVVRVSVCAKRASSRYVDRSDSDRLLRPYFSCPLSVLLLSFPFLPFIPFQERFFSIVIACVSRRQHTGASVVYDVYVLATKYTSPVEPSNQRISFYLMHFKYSDARFVVGGGCPLITMPDAL